MRARFIAPVAIVALAAGLVAAQNAGPDTNRRDQRFASEEATRDRIFGPDRIWLDSSIVVDSLARASLRDEIGLDELDSLVTLHWTAGPDGRPAGCYRVAHEVGKYLPFDFLVALDEHLAVREVVVLTYREARGGQVQRARFTNQFRGKTRESPLSLNRDIVGISGATLSAHAVSRGVKKTLWWAARMFPAEGEGR